jgi:hypothetical protein
MSTIPGPDLPEEFGEHASLLQERTVDLDDDLRRLGLYMEAGQMIGVDTPMGPRPALALMTVIGDVAFTGRVQDPEAAAFDNQFRVIEAEEGTNAFLDERERIKRNIAAGRDPLDDGDGDDE